MHVMVYYKSLAYKGDINMTKDLTLRSLDLPSFHRFGIGFDSIFDELNRMNTQQANTNYPPYNIIKHDDDRFSIELAVAGFKEGDIEIVLEKNILTVKGDRTTVNLSESSSGTYLHQGIGGRRFSREFTLAEHVEVDSAAVADGILTINLERRIPEDQKPKVIPISYTPNK